jgi:hypothetical protein
MAKSGGGLATGFVLLIVLIVGIFLLYEYAKKKQAQKQATGSSSGFSSGGASSGQQGPGAWISAKLFAAFTQLAKYAASGQELANLTLGTSSPSNSSLIPLQQPTGLSQSFLNSLAQPLDVGGALGGLGSLNGLSTTDPTSTALLQMQQPQTFDMSGISFPLSS